MSKHIHLIQGTVTPEDRAVRREFVTLCGEKRRVRRKEPSREFIRKRGICADCNAHVMKVAMELSEELAATTTVEYIGTFNYRGDET